MADLTGGRLVARVLKQAGVGHVFTLCGGHILPIYEGLLDEGVAVVDTRPEQAAPPRAGADAPPPRRLGGALGGPGPRRARAPPRGGHPFPARQPHRAYA